MAEYKTGSMGFKLTFQGPDSVEDYDRIAGKAGACLEDACDNTIYRGTLPEFQEEFAKRVEAFTGVTRNENTEATEKARARSKTPDKVKPIMETVARYVKRATAGMEKERMEELQRIAQEVADTIKVDPSPSKRQGAIPKDLLLKADSVLELDEDEREAKITRWIEMVGEYEVARDDSNVPTRESLAMLAGEVLKTL